MKKRRNEKEKEAKKGKKNIYEKEKREEIISLLGKAQPKIVVLNELYCYLNFQIK